MYVQHEAIALPVHVLCNLKLLELTQNGSQLNKQI
jgi:hypothetical protein